MKKYGRQSNLCVGGIKMNVFNFIPEGIEECSVTAWIHTYAGTDTESQKKPAIIICPGGVSRNALQ